MVSAHLVPAVSMIAHLAPSSFSQLVLVHDVQFDCHNESKPASQLFRISTLFAELGRPMNLDLLGFSHLQRRNVNRDSLNRRTMGPWAFKWDEGKLTLAWTTVSAVEGKATRVYIEMRDAEIDVTVTVDEHHKALYSC